MFVWRVDCRQFISSAAASLAPMRIERFKLHHLEVDVDADLLEAPAAGNSFIRQVDSHLFLWPPWAMMKVAFSGFVLGVAGLPRPSFLAGRESHT